MRLTHASRFSWLYPTRANEPTLTGPMLLQPPRGTPRCLSSDTDQATIRRREFTALILLVCAAPALGRSKHPVSGHRRLDVLIESARDTEAADFERQLRAELANSVGAPTQILF